MVLLRKLIILNTTIMIELVPPTRDEECSTNIIITARKGIVSPHKKRRSAWTLFQSDGSCAKQKSFNKIVEMDRANFFQRT
jgi:hypothetical protein